MFYNDHSPAHFHAIYGDEECEINIETLEIIKGSMNKRAYTLILEWAVEHRSELLEDWTLARNKEDLKKIVPLR